ncbi:GLUG motif-containing protein [Paenibacillus sp. 32352]|uniref:GLUG motif-containing protein n=1 Tax=Paenibacillus sp. 32352 TaxID=1969111 RepID=UPI0015C4636D|nr:GLUG motif-containing protein [Paenibacillus sp. 32352]
MIKGKLEAFSKVFILSATVAMILAAAPATMAAPASPSGSGTTSDPYVLVSKENLEWFSNKVNGGAVTANAKLGSDIDARGLSMDPIGTSDHPFTGVFDGQEHLIKNLKIVKPNSNNVGLFGFTEYGSVIKNLGLENESVLGASFTGGLVGRSYSIIENCYTTGSVSSSYNGFNVGGLVGNNHGIIKYSYSGADVSASFIRAGGLVGQNGGTPTKEAEIIDSSATGSVAARGMVGGLVGENCSFGSVTNSTASGGVSGRDFTGDVVGRNVPW